MSMTARVFAAFTSRLLAFAISLGFHAFVLFVPEIDSGYPVSDPKMFPLSAKLRPATPEPQPLTQTASPKASVQKPGKARRPKTIKTVPAPEASVSGAAADPGNPGNSGNASSLEAKAPEAAAPVISALSSARLPPHGRIRFRVEMGDSGFEIGVAYQEWMFEAGSYRIVSSAETTGLAWLIRSVDIDMESLGRISGQGLQPEVFGVMRSGKKARERALFDWETMKVRVSDDSDHTLDPGAQDILSLYYHLGFLDMTPGQTVSMPLATGKKYKAYRLENLGDEDIEIPLGVLRTRHLRSSGERSTEIWLAYEYRLLPVKIRLVDNKGDAFIQVATEILFGE
jgi:hypothetical protein